MKKEFNFELNKKILESLKECLNLTKRNINLNSNILWEWKFNSVMDLFLMAIWFGLGLYLGLII